MVKNKEKPRKRLIIGDTVIVNDCRKIGLNKNAVAGILIWQPNFGKNEKRPQLYAIWVWDRLTKNEQESQREWLMSIYSFQYPGQSTDTYNWEAYPWRAILNCADKEHILFVPRWFRNDIVFYEEEPEDIIPGDLVLDRRWATRFAKNPIRVALAIKYDRDFEMNRVCLENPARETGLNFGNWVYPLLRKDMIRISRRKLPKPPEEEPIVPTKGSMLQKIFINTQEWEYKTQETGS